MPGLGVTILLVRVQVGAALFQHEHLAAKLEQVEQIVAVEFDEAREMPVEGGRCRGGHDAILPAADGA